MKKKLHFIHSSFAVSRLDLFISSGFRLPPTTRWTCFCVPRSSPPLHLTRLQTNWPPRANKTWNAPEESEVNRNFLSTHVNNPNRIFSRHFQVYLQPQALPHYLHSLPCSLYRLGIFVTAPHPLHQKESSCVSAGAEVSKQILDLSL